MKQLDDIMTELYAAKKQNSLAQKDLSTYLSFLQKKDQARMKSTKKKKVQAKH
jgi:succinate dehydrogenase flavin-adding protein (antitoxin of CptAB toxin-antitoxin module)